MSMMCLLFPCSRQPPPQDPCGKIEAEGFVFSQSLVVVCDWRGPGRGQPHKASWQVTSHLLEKC